MPTTTDFLPPPQESAQKRAIFARQMAAQQASGSGGDVIDAAFVDTPTSSLIRFAADKGYPVDPDFTLDKKTLDELTDGIDPDLWPVYENARSRSHADYLRLSNEEKMEARRTLNSYGVTGAAASIAANLLDPATLAVGFATGGLGLSGTGTTIARGVRAGLINSVPFAGLGLIRSAEDPTYTATDVLRDAAGGFGLGYAQGALASSGRAVRALAGGAGMAVPSMGVDLLSQEDRHSVWQVGLQQFLLGAAFSALPGAHKQTLVETGNRGKRDIEYQQIRDSGQTLTTDGDRHYAEQIDPTHRIMAASEGMDLPAETRAAIVAEAGYGPRQPWQMTRAEYVKNGPDGIPLGNDPERLALLRDAKNNPDGYLFHATSDEMAARGIDEEGLTAGGVSADPMSEYAESPDGFILVFKRSDFDGVTSTNDVSLAENYTPVKPIGVFKQSEFGGHIGFGSRSQELGVVQDNPSDIHYQTVADAVARGETIPPEVLADYPDLGRITAPAATEVPPKLNAFERITLEEQRRTLKRQLDPDVVDLIEGRTDQSAGGWTREQILDPATPGSAKAREYADLVAVLDGTPPTNIPDATGRGAASPQQIAAQTLAEEAAAKIDAKKIATDFNADFSNPVGYTWGKVLVDNIVGQHTFGPGRVVGTATLDALREVGAAVLPDPVPRKGDYVRGTAQQWAKSRSEGEISLYQRHMKAAYAAHLKETRDAGLTPLTPTMFRREVVKAVHRPAIEVFGGISQGAEAMRAMYARNLELMKRHGVPGSEGVTHSESHTQHLWNQAAIQEKVQQVGYAPVRDAIAAAIVDKGTGTLTPRLRTAMADAIMANGGKKSALSDLDAARLHMLPETLYERVQSQLGANRLSDAELQSLKAVLLPASDGQNPSILKSRIDLDITHRQKIKDLDGKDMDLALEDLTIQDADELASRYIQQATGSAAVHEVLRKASAKYGKTFTTPDSLTSWLKTEAVQAGIPQEQAKRLGDMIGWGLEVTAGRAHHDLDVRLQAAGRILQKMNFTAAMSNLASGVQNATEVAQIVSELGSASAWKGMTAIPAMRSMALDGTLDHPTAQLMASLGFGQGRMARGIVRHNPDENIVMGRFERGADRAAQLASDISGQSYTQQALEEMVFGAMIHKWSSWADNPASVPSELRLNGIGFRDDALFANVLSELRTHKRVVDGVIDPNVEAWGDTHAAMAFTNSLRLQGYRIIQKGDRTALPTWMSTPAGRLIVQLRTFGIQGLSGKTMYEARMSDARSVGHIVGATTVGMAAYIGATYLRSLGRPDQQKYLDENLSPERIMKAGAARSSIASVLPSLIDTGLQGLGMDQQFSYARNSGMDSSLITGNPTYQWGRAAARAAFVLPATARGEYDFSQKDFQAIQNGMFFPNVVGARGLVKQFENSLRLPKESTKR